MQSHVASLLHQTSQKTSKLGVQLSAQRQAQEEAARQVEKERIELQIKQAPLRAQHLIKGLPQFLQQCADAGYSMAHIVYRPGCIPAERVFPNYTMPSRDSSFNKRNMTQYAIRRYMKGIIQHVALWGLKQEFRVGLTSFVGSQGEVEIRAMSRNHRGILPFYMPGMFEEHIPQSVQDEFLFFAW